MWAWGEIKRICYELRKSNDLSYPHFLEQIFFLLLYKEHYPLTNHPLTSLV